MVFLGWPYYISSPLYPQLQFSYGSRLILYFYFAYMLTVPSNQPTVLPSLFRTGPTQTAAYKIQKVPQFQTVKIFLQGRIVRPIPFTLWAAQRMTFIRWIIRVYLKRRKYRLFLQTQNPACVCEISVIFFVYTFEKRYPPLHTLLRERHLFRHIAHFYLWQHRTIPALRLKHRSGGCGT